MSEGFDLNGFIEDFNVRAAREFNTPENFIMLSTNKDSSVSASLREPVTGKVKKRAFNFSIAKKTGYYRVTANRKMLENITMPAGCELRAISSDNKNVYADISPVSGDISRFLTDILEYYVKNFEPSEKFGCCGKYRECSAAGKCLHENLFYSKACWYRKNLESGRIFYTDR
ncbi:MAG: hypothetical protein IJ874_04605 [Ruminococcus sp.]|nr:hypothetical protein [Ruminococcus sp.]